MLSSGRNMLVVFHSDSSGSGSGFSATTRNVSREDGKHVLYIFFVLHTP